MIFLVAIVLGFVLSAIAALHFYWAFGGYWPAANEQGLIDTVVGDPRLKRMPSPRLSAFVALAIELAGLVALALAFRPVPVVDAVFTFAGVVLALIFFARGLAGYVPAWRARHSLEPFATRDRLLYSPLCLLLAAGFAFLVSARMGSS